LASRSWTCLICARFVNNLQRDHFYLKQAKRTIPAKTLVRD
jgi:hypothetical protein